MKLKYAILPAASLILLTGGCFSAARAKTAIAATAGGAAGYLLSDGNATAAAGGGAAAAAAQAYANHIEDKSKREEVERAYAAGEAKATRDLYEAMQRNQSVDTAQPSEDPDSNALYLPITAPARVVNGVKVEASVEYIRVNDGDPHQ